MARHASRRALLLAAAALPLAGCAGGKAALRLTGLLPESDGEVAQKLADAARASAEAWNRGDLEAFLAPYDWDVVVVHPGGPEQGLDRLAARLKVAARWGGERPELTASVRHSEIRRLNADHAVHVASIVLSRGAFDEVRRWRTAIWRRGLDGWRIVHEQSY